MDATHTGYITCSAPVSKNVILIKIKLLEPQTIDFKAGQYLAVFLPGTDKVAYYSIASSPGNKHELELLVKEDKLGAGSTYLFSLKPGACLKLRGPLGNAYLRAESSRDLLFVAGASGASFVRSMLKYLDESKQISQRQIYYFLGSQDEHELIESDHMHRLAAKHPNFHFIPAMSNQDDWPGHRGLITDVVAQVMPADLSAWEAYSAGSPAMVRALADVLLVTKQLPPDRFFSDSYTPQY